MKNIKKYILAIFILIICITLTGCKDNNIDNNIIDNNTTNQIDTYVIEGKIFTPYAKAMLTNYSMTYEAEIENSDGTKTKQTVKVSRKDEQFGLTIEDINLNIVIENGEVYIVVHNQELIMIGDLQKEEIQKVLQDYQLNVNLLNKDYTYISSGKEVIDNVELDYEEYINNNENNKYYFLNNELKYIDNNGNLMKILAFSYEANEELFKVPMTYNILYL